jgi:hypothetical protein
VAALHERFATDRRGFVEGTCEPKRPHHVRHFDCSSRAFVNTAPRVEVLRETVKVAKFELPPDALPEPDGDAPEATAPEATMKRLKASAIASPPDWERRVAAALWVIAAAIVATLWLTKA